MPMLDSTLPLTPPSLALKASQAQRPRAHAQGLPVFFVVGTMAVSLLATGICAWLRLGPTSALVFTPMLALALLIHGLWTQNLLLKRLLVFGMVLGVGELVSDYFCVAINQTLVYPADEPFLWVSPAYMPVAWMVLMVQLGTLADVLMRRFRHRFLVTVLMAVLGGIHIPIFETLANYAGGWSYHNTPLILDTTPTYIVLAEAMLSAVLPWMVSRVKTAQRWWQPLFLGWVQAAWVLASVVLAFWLVGR